MDSDIVAYSQCEKCDEQGLFLDPENCALCLAGREPVEIYQEENELPESVSS